MLDFEEPQLASRTASATTVQERMSVEVFERVVVYMVRRCRCYQEGYEGEKRRRGGKTPASDAVIV
ncbi:MAG: hypothetical protein BRD30_00360 [Bacteroidetes bacterium QH_2_63_10]|jgi:hypothetical protein|nr:MAG: hypothetical protein BRD30_00360 [Bacteroidetes bacterium QH_2_63_10]